MAAATAVIASPPFESVAVAARQALRINDLYRPSFSAECCPAPTCTAMKKDIHFAKQVARFFSWWAAGELTRVSVLSGILPHCE